MSQPIRVGIVGCGRILPAHLRGFRLLRDRGFDAFRITALCARRVEDAWMFRKRGEGPPPRVPVAASPDDPLGVPHSYVSDFQPEFLPEVYADYRAMLASAQVDAVLVLTALDTHHLIALASLDAGKHALVEKPLAITMRAARRMVELARARDLVLSTGEVAHYGVQTRAVHWAVSTGELGQFQAVIGGGIGAGEWSPDRIVARTPWRHKKLLAGGGASIDMGVHRFNVLRYVGGEVAEVGGLAQIVEPVRHTRDASGRVIDEVQCEVDDTFFASVRFASGAVGQINFSWAGHGQQFGLPLVYYGSRGSLTGNTLTRDDGNQLDVIEALMTRAPQDLRARMFPLGLTDGFALELYDWLDSIRVGREAETSGAEGLRDLAAAYAILESSVAGRWVAVEEVESGDLDTYQRELDEHYGLV